MFDYILYVIFNIIIIIIQIFSFYYIIPIGIIFLLGMRYIIFCHITQFKFWKMYSSV